MSLRLKLLLALVPLGLALVVVGVSAVWSLTALGTESQLILQRQLSQRAGRPADARSD